MSYNLVKLEKVPNIRDVWPNEAHHFTHWVADEGLELLSEELGIGEIIDPICEVSVGSKRADIVAKLKGDSKEVIIENQLESTNHDHLGKIVTYAAGRKEAAIVIWIVTKATDEHRKAVDWLNRRTDDNMDFYLVEIQLLKINPSTLVPRFKLISSPLPKETLRVWSDAEKFLIDFWNEFNSYADSIADHFFSPENFNTKHKPYPQTGYDLHVRGIKNASVVFILQKTKKRVKCGIYLPNDKNSYLNLRNHAQEIEGVFGTDVEWDSSDKKKSSSVCVNRECEDFEDLQSQNYIFEWMCDTAFKWKPFLIQYCQDKSSKG